MDTCTDILGECGFLPTGSGIGIVDLSHIPEDLNAEKLDRFLREEGAELCGSRGAHNHEAVSKSPTK